MEEAPIQPARHQFEFTGKASEYFGIWIVNLLLTIITLGIYSAWAKVRTNRYFYGNTHVGGSSFDYTADPIKILIGRIIALALFIAYQICLYFSNTAAFFALFILLAAVPLIYVSSLRFRMRYSQWRNISFGFDRDLRSAYLLFSPILFYIALLLAGPLFFGVPEEELAGSVDDQEISSELFNYVVFTGWAVILGGLLFPLWQTFYYNFVGNRVRFGSSKFNVALKASSFYGIYLMVGGFVLVVSLLVGFLVVTTGIIGIDEEGNPSGIFAAILIFYFSSILGYVGVYALLRTRLTNLLYSNIQFQEATFESTLRFPRMFYLYLTNTLGIIITLGLAIPWAKIRLAHYRAEQMAMIADEIDVVADQAAEVEASGEAMTEFFDFEIGL